MILSLVDAEESPEPRETHVLMAPGASEGFGSQERSDSQKGGAGAMSSLCVV